MLLLEFLDDLLLYLNNCIVLVFRSVQCGFGHSVDVVNSIAPYIYQDIVRIKSSSY